MAQPGLPLRMTAEEYLAFGAVGTDASMRCDLLDADSALGTSIRSRTWETARPS